MDAVACFIPGRAKDLSAPPLMWWPLACEAERHVEIVRDNQPVIASGSSEEPHNTKNLSTLFSKHMKNIQLGKFSLGLH